MSEKTDSELKVCILELRMKYRIKSNISYP